MPLRITRESRSGGACLIANAAERNEREQGVARGDRLLGDRGSDFEAVWRRVEGAGGVGRASSGSACAIVLSRRRTSLSLRKIGARRGRSNHAAILHTKHPMEAKLREPTVRHDGLAYCKMARNVTSGDMTPYAP